MLKKVLIANRGEIAVRVIRACKDAGIGERGGLRRPRPGRALRPPRRRGLLPRTAPPPPSPTSTSRRSSRSPPTSGADSVHPGYGFLAENADFAQAVIDAGLIWIGPPPDAIEALGDKARAKHIAAERRRPARARHQGPGQGRRRGRRVRRGQRPAGRDQGRLRRRRSRPQGRPHARGDPRRLRVRGPRGRHRLRSRRVPGREVPRPAAPRRDPVPGRPARQRRGRLHPRLLAAAPPPEARRGGARAVPHRRPGRRASTSPPRRSCARPATSAPAPASSSSPQDGTISFLEVNTRLQVEHCVSEEVTGIDLVREMFRIAAGEELGYDDPEIRGHSIEFRINAEDGGRNFMPAPGTLTAWTPAAGPRRPRRRRLRERRDHPRLLRLPHRQAHRHRPRPHPGARALAPRAGRVRGRRHADRDPVPPRGRQRPGVRRRLHATGEGEFDVYTTWIETDFDNQIEPYAGDARARPTRPAERQTVTVEVGGRRLEVVLPAGLGGLSRGGGGAGGAKKPKRAAQEGRRRRVRRRGHLPDAGHHRQGRRRRGPGGRRGRRHRRPRGDEDGAAPQGPQGRHRHRPRRPRSAPPSPTAP